MDPGLEPASQVNDGQAGEVTYQRRREQVRRAQRLHRNRKAAYVCSLEREVEELRTETAALRAVPAADESFRVKTLEREVAQLRTEKAERVADAKTIARLKQLLESYGINLPPEFRYRHSRQYHAVAELCGDKPSTQHLQVTLPSPQKHALKGDGATGQAAEPVPHSDGSLQATQQQYAQHVITDTRVTRSRSLVCEDGTNGTQAGVDFVLSLEHICLYHHKLPSPELLVYGQLGTGHAMMLSSPVMARIPDAATNPGDIPVQHGCQWNVPAAELEKLLSLSQSLQLDREVTPVGIWQRLRSRARFDELTHEDLDTFKLEIAPLVVCYGFGAVVPEAIVDEILHKVFENQRKRHGHA